MSSLLENILTSGLKFADAESIIKHRYRLLNMVMMITAVSTLSFGLLSDLGYHDMGRFSLVEYLFSFLALSLMQLLRRSKRYYYLVAYSMFAITFTIFTAALVLVTGDEYRAVWFLLTIVLSYMLIGRFAGHLATVLSLLIIVVVHATVGLGVSPLGLNTILLSMIICSVMVSSYSAKVNLYEEELQQKNSELAVLATTDDLTGIYNRRAFSELGHKYVEAALRNRRPLSFLMFDIDHFKQLNDSYGHHVGDIVLRNFSHQINSSLRKSDIFGRLGGEEFGLLLFETDLRQAQISGERILECVRDMEHEIDGEKHHITVSIGIACLAEGRDADLSALERRADAALYEAKNSGRDCIVTAT